MNNTAEIHAIRAELHNERKNLSHEKKAELTQKHTDGIVKKYGFKIVN
jgi:hypothetical protein